MEIARHEAVRAILKVSINEIKLFLLKKKKKEKASAPMHTKKIPGKRMKGEAMSHYKVKSTTQAWTLNMCDIVTGINSQVIESSRTSISI